MSDRFGSVSAHLRRLLVSSAIAGFATSLAFGQARHDDKEEHNSGTVARWSGGGWVSGAGGNPPITFPSLNVELLSWTSLDDMTGGDNGADCWGYVSPSGREYALMGTFNGVSIIEVTNPRMPVVRAVVDGVDNLWRDVCVYQNYMYVCSEATGSGVQVVNLANIDNGVATLVRTVNTPGTSRTHTIFVDEVSGFLYRAGGTTNGIRMYSLSNPANPTFVGDWQDRYVHECQVVTYTSGVYAGKQIAFLSTGYTGRLEIVDVTNKAAPINLGVVGYPNPGYSHQSWLSEDRQFAYLNDELDEHNGIINNTTTHIFNVSNLSAPVWVGSYSAGTTVVGHNLYVHDGFIYQADYVDGLNVFDQSNPLAPVRVAYFDTEPTSSAPVFDSAWGNYPFLPSGNVLISDLEKGLFVVDVNLPIAGDVNCDGVVSVGDIAAFVLALTDSAGYATQYPNCPVGNADINDDNFITVGDIAGFVSLLTGV
ncbi:MAG: choice-of-anchor B family protein [Phycisphaerae bacterium]|nr:choice-of-anchor B family protein [Phycisphaerae bacterium]